MLLRQMAELLYQGVGVVKHGYERIDTVENTQGVSAELRAIHIVNIHSLEQGLGGSVTCKQTGMTEELLRDL